MSGCRRLRAFLIRTFLEQHDEARHHENADVEQQRPVLGVIDVVLDASSDLVDRVGLSTEAMDLSPAGNARLDLVAREIATDLFREFLVMAERMRPWSDQRHAPLQHVEKLRQLIDRGPPDETANTGHARILSRCLLHPLLRHCFVIHGPEFVDIETPIVEAKPRLAKEHRAGAVELDRYRNGYQKRREEDDTGARQHHILDLLDHRTPARDRPLHNLEQRKLAKMPEHRPECELETHQIGADEHVDRQLLQSFDRLDDLLIGIPRQGAYNIVDFS